MSEIRQNLLRAAEDGVITPEQVDRLVGYFVPSSTEALPETGVISTPPDTETPRFIRGFHDVLITIGIIILLVGLGTLASVIAVPFAVFGLSEILVRRQRLALPAVVLTLAMGTAMFIIAGIWLVDDLPSGTNSFTRNAFLFMPPTLVMALYAWRYRVPIAVSSLILMLAGFLLALLFRALDAALGQGYILFSHPYLSSLVLMASALGLFVVAMRYDLSDPLRVTRRSDIAFWLHLVTAPTLLYASMSFLFLNSRYNLFELGKQDLINGALPVTVIVVVLMLVGIVIDRRAFVTSGLISLIIAFTSIVGGVGNLENGWAVAMLFVGMFVLALGIGWRGLRRYVISALPEAWQHRLPPAM